MILCASAVAAAAGSGCVSFQHLFRGDGRVVQTAHGTCVDLTPENATMPVHACESATTYDFRVVSELSSYPKAKFQTQLRERLVAYARASHYPWKKLGDAIIEVWVQAPVFRPRDTELIAVVTGPGGNFLVRLPLNPAHWTVDTERVALLGHDLYPSFLARRAGWVSVAPKPLVAKDKLEEYLGTLAVFQGVRPPARIAQAGPGVVTVAVEPFAEPMVANAILRDRRAREFVQAVELLPAGEPEGSKAKAFSFPFVPR